MTKKTFTKVIACVILIALMLCTALPVAAVCPHYASYSLYTLTEECAPNTCGILWLLRENRYTKETVYHCDDGWTNYDTTYNVAKPGNGCC